MSQSPPDDVTQLLGQLTQLAQMSRDCTLKLHATEQVMRQVSSALSYIHTRYGGGSPPMAFYCPDDFSAHEQDLKIGSLSGVRYWNVTTPWHDDLGHPAVQLIGARSQAWKPGVNKARCLNSAAVRVPVAGMFNTMDSAYRAHTFDEIPTRDCGCGFWVYWSPDAAFGNITMPDVAGVVEGWGGYRTGTKGFRCSKAKVVALAVTPRDEEWRTRLEGALAEAYQVPIFSQVTTMLKRYPPSREGPPSLGPSGYYPGSWTYTPANMACMTCHQRDANTVTLAVNNTYPVFTCGSCPPPARPCTCASHYFAPAGPGSPPAARLCLHATALTPADAMAILDAKRDGMIEPA